MIGVIALHASVADAGLRDHPIATVGSPVYMTTGWTANALLPKGQFSIPATVPGDLLTDLQRSGTIVDPWLDTTWIDNSSLWTGRPWTYSTTFSVDNAALGTAALLLVFEGVKMGATVRVNDAVVGVFTDQFLRYTFDLSAAEGLTLLAGEGANVIDVTFGVDDIAEDGRFMACTGGWDWAPYSYTLTKSSATAKHNTTGPAHSFTKGLWKSVYTTTVPLGSIAITHVTPHTKYAGAYPIAPLVDGAHGGFTVNVTAHLWAPEGGATGSLAVAGSWGSSSRSTAVVTLPAGESTLSLQLAATASEIKLWWPRGEGAQPLYDVQATWTPARLARAAAIAAHASSTNATRRIGFRVFALVTVNDTDAAYVAANASADGTGRHGMFFRVNGAAIYSRGANMVPMEELEGRMTGAAHRILVKSSADAGMNTLRVWGGGIYFPTEFYDACDEYGVMVYHDMAYASNGNGGTHGPIATPTQDAELRHQIRRLSHHAAIVIWDGVNEVVVNSSDTTSSVFAKFVMSVVAQEDQSRVVWPSSPAAGWVTGVNRLFQTPNFLPGAEGLTTHGGGHIWDQGIETHAPYQLGSGWPTVNGGVVDGCFNNAGTGNGVSVPNVFGKHPHGPVGAPTGVASRNKYASEFGTGGSSSFESMSGALSKQHWGLHGGMAADVCSAPDVCLGEHQCNGSNPMTQRNYGCDGQIRIYWGNTTAVDLDATGEAAFKGQTYQCQMVQAFVLKQVYEARRANNQLGHLVWMLNEIWPTVGWGSLEYGPGEGTPGQVKGGRWKPVHYFYKRSLMTDVMATCGAEGQCYVSNHRASRAFSGTVTLMSYDHFGDGKGAPHFAAKMAMAPGPGALEWFNVSLWNASATSMISTVTDEEGAVISEHLVQLASPKDLVVPIARLSFVIAPQANADGTIDIAVTSDKVALWVTLTTLAQGRFTDNAFFLPATTKTVRFVPFSAATRAHDLAALEASLRIEDYSMYRALPPAPTHAPTPGPPTPPCDVAMFQNNTDYHDGAGLGHEPASSALACCQQCEAGKGAAEGCTDFTLSGGTCWYKANDNGRRTIAGAISGAVHA
jgi:hypothetical protein